MLDKEFVPYQESLELKELGFDEPCLAYYEGVELTHGMLNDIGKKRYLQTPTFSQAFRWFREKYNLNYWVKEESQVRFSWRIYKGDGYATWDCHPLLSNTYEEAELACLRKLIEIVKNK